MQHTSLVETFWLTRRADSGCVNALCVCCAAGLSGMGPMSGMSQPGAAAGGMMGLPGMPGEQNRREVCVQTQYGLLSCPCFYRCTWLFACACCLYTHNKHPVGAYLLAHTDSHTHACQRARTPITTSRVSVSVKRGPPEHVSKCLPEPWGCSTPLQLMGSASTATHKPAPCCAVAGLAAALEHARALIHSQQVD